MPLGGNIPNQYGYMTGLHCVLRSDMPPYQKLSQRNIPMAKCLFGTVVERSEGAGFESRQRLSLKAFGIMHADKATIVNRCGTPSYVTRTDTLSASERA